jgi:hypothetical protein
MEPSVCVCVCVRDTELEQTLGTEEPQLKKRDEPDLACTGTETLLTVLQFRNEET